MEQEPTIKKVLAVDCISRADARRLIVDTFRKNLLGMTYNKIFKTLYEGIDELTSAIPQEPKTGHWKLGICDNCGYDWGKVAPIASVPNFCPNCGRAMFKTQESKEEMNTEDIELVIKIPEKDWEFIKSTEGCRWSRAILEGVINGTPLSRGHGDLIDRNDLLAESYCIDDWSGNEVSIVDVMTVKMAPTIINHRSRQGRK